MEDKDKKSFLILMAMLSEAFADNTSSERAKIYWEFLKKYQMNEIAFAIKEAVRRLKFYPKVSEIIEIIEIEHGPYRDLSDTKTIELENKKKDEKAVEWIKQMASAIGRPVKERPARLPYKDD